jgi:HEAT repeat protein
LYGYLRIALDASETELRAALKSDIPLKRLAAAYAVGERRLFWQDDLMALLTDDSDAVRQSARRGLVILSYLKLNPERATTNSGKHARTSDSPARLHDFGPLPGASVAARRKAAREWADWWKEQGRVVLKQAIKPRPDTQGDRLASDLLKVRGTRQSEMLWRYSRTSGVEYTEALAYAIPNLDGPIRKEARDALAQRFCDRKETTLLLYLEDSDAEIRRAAALALGMRDAKHTVCRIAPLLLDSEPSVVRAAHATLRSLTGEEHGPTPSATEEEKQAAVESYLAWRPTK